MIADARTIYYSQNNGSYGCNLTDALLEAGLKDFSGLGGFVFRGVKPRIGGNFFDETCQLPTSIMCFGRKAGPSLLKQFTRTERTMLRKKSK